MTEFPPEAVATLRTALDKATLVDDNPAYILGQLLNALSRGGWQIVQRAQQQVAVEYIACTCDSASRKPHTVNCELTQSLVAPVLCACGDETGEPHPHPSWADSSNRILAKEPAYDGRRMEIKEQP